MSANSTPPEAASEEPVDAVPTSQTTPVWANTVPVEPAEDPDEAKAASEVEEAMPALPMQKGDPEWSKAQSSPNGEGSRVTPGWATTVPTSSGEALAETETETETETEPDAEPEATGDETEAESPLTEPHRAVAADALKSTWPPATDSAPAPPEETDIWPPEPPTEKAMPAWPPPSELEEPVTPAQPIPTWPDSFEPASASPPTLTPAAAAPMPPTITPAPAPAAEIATPEAASPASDAGPPVTASAPPAKPEPIAPRPKPDSVAPANPEPVTPDKPEPVVAAQPEPVSPAQSGPPPRHVWEPGHRVEPATPAPKIASTPPLQIPAWAPRVPLAAEPGTPTWFSPREEIPHTTAQPVAQSTPNPAPAPKPSAPIPPGGGHLPVAQIPIPPATPAASAGSQSAAAKSTWEVVEQKSKSGPHAKVEPGPTAEDRSYAEWFAWAKRGGAPASACHSAAQGAFKALSGGKDVATAVQWATAAMSRPPENVSYARQTYCAWFSLANIDLNLDQQRAHAFAAAALQALDLGQDAAAAHAAGLAAAGIK